MPDICPVCAKPAPFLVILEEGPERACVDHVGSLIADSTSPYAPVINLTNVGASPYFQLQP